MNLAREVEKLNQMLASLQQKNGTAVFQRRWHRRGANRRWILKNLPVKPIKIPEFLRKAEKDGMVKGSVYAMLIQMIDEGDVAENRYFRTIWRP